MFILDAVDIENIAFGTRLRSLFRAGEFQHRPRLASLHETETPPHLGEDSSHVLKNEASYLTLSFSSHSFDLSFTIPQNRNYELPT